MTDDDPMRVSVREAADYIASLTQELAVLAARNQMDMLRYLLEMACMEARELAGHDSEVGTRHGVQAVELG